MPFIACVLCSVLSFAAVPARSPIENAVFRQAGTHVTIIGRGEDFGKSFAISGDVLAVTDQNTDDLYIYQLHGGAWKRAFSYHCNVGACGEVAISGGTVALTLDDYGVTLFSVAQGRWALSGTVVGTSAEQNANLGEAMAFNGSSLAVASDQTVYIFSKIGADWDQVGSVPTPSGRGALSLALSGRFLAVGDSLAGNGYGEVNIYAGSGGQWTEAGTINHPGGQFGYEDFGTALTMSDNILATVGTDQNGGSKVFVYAYTNGSWYSIDQLQPVSIPLSYAIVQPIALSGTTLAVVSNVLGNKKEPAGVSRVYIWQEHDLVYRIAEELTVPLPSDYLSGVAISGHIVVTGMMSKDFIEPDGLCVLDW
ncbi:MAG TPA: hypothetical protein VME46_05640 [Acidimicrobiales bacterium]|nr:hypothetical protein [Acidimicrobiales bacterium]